MADLTDKQAAQTIKIAGADPTTGVEDNYAEVDSSGNVQTLVNNASGASAVNIQDGGNSITVDATSWPLPTGASTSANQTTIISDIGATNETVAPTDTSTSGLNGLIKRINQHLTTLEGYVDGLEGLVTTTNTEIGATNETTAASDSATSGLNGLIKRINQHLTTIEGYVDGVETLIGTTNTEIGATNETSAASDSATSGLNGLIKRINAHLTTIEGYVDGLEALITSSNVYLNSIDIKVSTAANQTTLNTRVGDVTETAPASDTASSGLNGRLQRVAQRLTTLIAFYSADFGASTGAIRVAALPGNASGIADFNAGTTGAQTPRVTANITRNGTELDYNFGTVGANSPRVASQIGNATGAAAFGAGATSAQTLRTVLVTDQTSIPVAGDVASGATDSGNPVKTGGVVNFNGTNFTDGQRANVQMDSTGAEYVNTSGRMPSYSASSTFTIAANSTDIFTITGSATKTIRIRRVAVSGTNTGNTNALVVMLKRSTANTGGTSSNLTEVPHDSNDAAATATALSYTANPTTGTLVGNIYHRLMYLPSLTSSNVRSEFEMGWGQDGAKPIILRGTSEVFAINMNGVAITGTTVMNISIDWTEN